MISLLFSKVKIGLILGAIVAISGFFYYTMNLSSKLGKLEVEREQLIGINTNQTQQIETLLTDQSASDERIISLLKDIEGLQKESQDLRDKFIEHDLKELAIRKSGLIEKAINKGTQEVFDEFNEITSLPSP